MRRLPVELRAIVRRRRLGRWGFYGVLIALFAAIFSEHLGCFGWQGSDHSRFDQKSFVIEAVTRHGTLLLVADPVCVEAKMLGLNDETVQPQACAAYLGRKVVIKLEPLQTRDLHGRLLAYLYLDEHTVLNVELVRQGAATADRSIPHSLRAVIDGAESDAKRRRRGVWK
jgi:hypothetical protein